MIQRGRPRKDIVKTKQLRIRLTEEEYCWIKESAEQYDTTMSDILRWAFSTWLEYIPPQSWEEIYDRVQYDLLGERMNQKLREVPRIQMKEDDDAS